jgi:3-hydroxybutyryl-CoA dehydrogenase
MIENQVKKISVIGSGAMGSQIAMVCALAGYEVTLQDINEESLLKAKDSLKGHMDRRIQKGRLTAEEVNHAFGRLSFLSSLEKAVEDTDFVIEAIIENLEIKRNLFKELD